MIEEIDTIQRECDYVSIREKDVNTSNSQIQLEIRVKHSKKKKYYVTLYFPKNYPIYPPSIFVFEDRRRQHLISSPRHQYNDGSLCLFPDFNEEQRWDPNRDDLKTLLQRLRSFLEKYTERGTLTIWSNAFVKFIIPKRFIEEIWRRKINTGSFIFKNQAPLVPNIPSSIFIITQLRKRGGTRIISFDSEDLEGIGSSDAFESILNMYSEICKSPFGKMLGICSHLYELKARMHKREEGIFIRVSSRLLIKLKALTSETEYEKVVEQLSKHNYKRRGIWKLLKQSNKHVLFISKDDATIFFHGKEGVVRMDVFIHDLMKQLWESVSLQMNPILRYLANKHVTIIGLGSIGSVIAVSLSKSGVGRFSLWDYDVVEPKNIPRHIANISQNYYHKSAVVASEIIKNNPSAMVRPFFYDPLNLEPRVRKLFERTIHDSDLVILAGLSERSERLVTEIVLPMRKVMLYVSTNYDASLGQIYRVYPGVTPCWECIRLHRDSNPEVYPRIDEQGKMQQVHYENDNWPGLGVDTSSIALAATRFSLQTLCSEISEETTVPITLQDVPYDFFIWSNVKSREYEYGINPFKVDRFESCSLCMRV